jgi:hypothetical protein
MLLVSRSTTKVAQQFHAREENAAKMARQSSGWSMEILRRR